jgi:hypothetical protein
METNENNNKAVGSETASSQDAWPLDDLTIQLLAEYNQRAFALDAERRGVLTHFARIHNLQGNWQLGENGRELIRTGGELPK